MNRHTTTAENGQEPTHGPTQQARNGRGTSRVEQGVLVKAEGFYARLLEPVSGFVLHQIMQNKGWEMLEEFYCKSRKFVLHSQKCRFCIAKVQGLV